MGTTHPVRVGNCRFAVAIDGDRLQVLAPHDRPEPAAADGIAFTHHDRSKKNAVLASRTDGGDAAARGEGLYRCGDRLPPETGGISEFGDFGSDAQADWSGTSAGNDQGVEAGLFQPVGELSAGGTVVDRSRQGGARYNREPGRGRGGRATERADRKDQRHIGIEGGKLVVIPHQADTEAAAAEIGYKQFFGYRFGAECSVAEVYVECLAVPAVHQLLSGAGDAWATSVLDSSLARSGSMAAR